MTRRIPRGHPSLDGLAKTHKLCRTCGETKPLTPEFWPRDKNQPDGFQGWCKACKQAKQRSLYTYEQGRNQMLRTKYGIGIAEYDQMFDAQGGACAICGNQEWAKPSRHKEWGKDGRPSSQYVLHVDHDHVTGQIRALLCNRCNRGIGAFEDDPAVLVKAKAYLDEWHAKLRKAGQ